MNRLKDNWFKISVLVILLGFLSIFFYFQLRSGTQKTEVVNQPAQATTTPQDITLQKELSLLKNQLSAQSRQISATQQQVSQIPSNTSLTPAEAAAEWQPLIAVIGCGNYDGTRQFGSGTLLFKDKTKPIYRMVTNAHVVEDTNGNTMPLCYLNFEWSKNDYKVTPDQIVTIGGTASDNLDFAFISIPADAELDSAMTHVLSACDYQADRGEKVVLLGYPSVANLRLTETEGIVSGFDGTYYTTDATIDHGNSGGAAISLDGDCYLGIPTAVVTDSVASLGRILSWKQITNYLNN